MLFSLAIDALFLAVAPFPCHCLCLLSASAKNQRQRFAARNAPPTGVVPVRVTGIHPAAEGAPAL